MKKWLVFKESVRVAKEWYVQMSKKPMIIVANKMDLEESHENLKRFIINIGITKMIFRDTKTKYREIDVQDLIDNDDSLNGTLGY